MKYPVPFLTFADKRGLDMQFFNTIRLGAACAKKLTKGRLVLLAHRGDIIGSARVVRSEAGPFRLMLDEHATGNHIELALSREQGCSYDPRNAPTRRHHSMLRNYGPQKVREDSVISVIYMERKA